MKFTKEQKAAFKETGRIGGEAGVGESKVRGDSTYYTNISKLAAKAREKKAKAIKKALAKLAAKARKEKKP